MSMNLAGLSTYTNETSGELIRASLLEAKTIGMITVQPGIKSAENINILSSAQVWDNGSCGFSNSGTTSLTTRTITVSDIKKNESICLNDLEGYYIQTKMKPGSYNEDIPFEQLYSEEVAGQTAKFVEQLTWQGNVASGSGSMNLANGLLQVIDGAGTSVVTGSTGALTAGAIIATVDEMVAAIPADAISADNLVLFCGYDAYRTYSLALRNANLFAYTGAEDQGGEFTQMVPGTNVRIVGVGGLVGTDRIILAETSNLYAGVDLLNDADKFSIFYSEDNDEVRVIQKFKVGFQIAFPARIVTNA